MSEAFRLLSEEQLMRARAQYIAARDRWRPRFELPAAGMTNLLVSQPRKFDPMSAGMMWFAVKNKSEVRATIGIAPASAMGHVAAALAGHPDASHAAPAGRVLITFVGTALADLVAEVFASGPERLQLHSVAAAEPGVGAALLARPLVIRDDLLTGVSVTLVGPASDFLPVTAIGRRRGGLADRASAVASSRVRLRVVLADDQLPVGDVRTLQAGDVVLFGRDIDQPLDVEVEGQRIGRCYLGKAASRRAIRMTKVPQ
jgi:hypothetical protein